MELPLPMIMGSDVAGIVDLVGQGVDSFQPEDEVFGKASAGQGGYTEYTVVNSTQIAQKPKSIGFIESAAIPTAGLAAWQSLFDIAGLKRGQTVLIHGAAGGSEPLQSSLPNGRAHMLSVLHQVKMQIS